MHTNGAPNAELQQLRELTQRNPDDPACCHNLGVALDDVGDAEAEAVFRDNVNRAPAFAPSWYSLGNVLLRRDDVAGAVEAYLAATRAAPNDVLAWTNLGVASARLGRQDDAVIAYERAVELSEGNHPEALYNLASMHTVAARYPRAPALWQRYLEFRPHHGEAWHGLAVCLYNRGDWQAAAEAYRKALALMPHNVEAMREMALTLKRLNEITAAEILLLEALRLAPNNGEVLNTLSGVLTDLRQPDESVAVLRQAIAAEPQRVSHYSNVLLTLQYSERTNADDIAAALKAFDTCQSALVQRVTHHTNSIERERRLRIGYVSGDFRVHSCAYFIEPLLMAHDRSRFEIFCYSNVERPDAATERLKAMADHWHEIRALGDDAACALIQSHGIDLLVDLSGHTSDHRLAVFARKPAPVQVSWLGYPDDVGLSAIDARISDDIIDPPDAGAGSGRGVLRLSCGMHCYAAGMDAPQVSPLPAVRNGHVTFGSFNNITKLTPTTLRVWTALMYAVPDSRLMLKHAQLGDVRLRTELLRAFLLEGVPPGRIDLLPRTDGQGGHMGMYHQIDIGLDSFPYNGTTTTCEALWMGVPVLTLCGKRPAARVGASLLTRIGLQSLVTETSEQFVAIGVALAADREALAHMRLGLRDRLRASPLGNPALWAPHMEAAYRTLWLQYVARKEA